MSGNDEAIAPESTPGTQILVLDSETCNSETQAGNRDDDLGAACQEVRIYQKQINKNISPINYIMIDDYRSWQRNFQLTKLGTIWSQKCGIIL